MTDVAEDHEVIDFAKETRVEVLNTKTNREVVFDVPWTTTLQVVWDSSYGKFQPPEHKDADDKFQCQHAGADLTPYLGLTLKQAQEQHICPARKYQIVGGTGGA
jgi:hypothetical protein